MDTPDREITIVKSELDRLGGLLKDSLSGGGCAGVIAVSYTHLDLYAPSHSRALSRYWFM